MNSSLHHQGLWKLPVDLPAVVKPPIRCPQRSQPSIASATPQRARVRGPLRNTVGIGSLNAIDYPPDEFWKEIRASTSSSKVFVVSISGDLIRDRSEDMTFTLYCSTRQKFLC